MLVDLLFPHLFSRRTGRTSVRAACFASSEVVLLFSNMFLMMSIAGFRTCVAPQMPGYSSSNLPSARF